MLYDISMTITNDIVSYPGDPKPVIEPHQQLRRGDIANVSNLSFTSHVGTHVDAPFHFNDKGTTVDCIPLEALVGRARVYQIDTERFVEESHLAELDFRDVTRVLFKTKNSELLQERDFHKDFVSIAVDGAKFLLDKGICLLGFDYISIEEFGSGSFPTHHTLLENAVVVVEGLDLSRISPGDYEILCLPLKIKGCDGAPARVFLRDSK